MHHELYAVHTGYHIALAVGGLVVGFVAGMKATCRWWKRHLASGYRMLGHVAGRRDVEPGDLRAAFDPDKDMRKAKDNYLSRYDP